MANQTISLDSGWQYRCLEINQSEVDSSTLEWTIAQQEFDSFYTNLFADTIGIQPNSARTNRSTNPTDSGKYTEFIVTDISSWMSAAKGLTFQCRRSDQGAQDGILIPAASNAEEPYTYRRIFTFVAHTNVNGIDYYSVQYLPHLGEEEQTGFDWQSGTYDNNTGIWRGKVDQTFTIQVAKGVYDLTRFNQLNTDYINIGQIAPTEDPYERGGYSRQEGGNGTFDTSSDSIGYSDQSLADTEINGALVTLFHASKEQLNGLAEYLWSADFFDQIVKIAQDPLDVILSVHAVPVVLPKDGIQRLYIGNVSTPVMFWGVTDQYVTVNMGTVNVGKFYDGALDYAPHTKIRIFLPYIGFRELDPDEIVGHTVGVQYKIDLLSGAFVCELLIDSNVLYVYEGNCMQPIPITGRNYAEYYSAIINGISGTIGAVVGGGAVGGIGGAVAGGLSAGAAGLWNAYNKSKGTYTHSGSVGGTHGIMGQQTPYLVYEIPRAVIPENNQEYNGYPSNITERLGNLTGWTVVRDIHLDGIQALSDELTELESILKTGVIF